MSSIGSLLSIARTAMQTAQTQVATAGHNIANAQSPGYSRQTVNTAARVPEIRPDGAIGTGVGVTGITRARDALLDAQVRSSSASASGANTAKGLLTSVQNVIGSSADTDLSGVLDQFYNAWGDLANNPASASSQANVQQRGLALATTFNNVANRLATIGASAAETGRGLITQVNTLTSQIAALNVQIVAGDAVSGSANDLKDARDRLVDQLAQIVPVTVSDNANGSNRVLINGISLVDGGSPRTMSLLIGPTFQVSVAGSSDPMRFTDGSLGRTMQFINTDLPGVQSSLDQLASGIVTDVNALHAAGWSPSAGAAGNWNPALGPTGSGVAFFDNTSAAAFTAHGMALSATVAANSRAIASSAVLNGTGDNTVALGVSALRDASPTSLAGSAVIDLRTLVNSVATRTATANDDATVNTTLQTQANDRRNSATAVSTDEELTNLMKYQQAYIAASKLVNVVDELAQSVLGLIR